MSVVLLIIRIIGIILLVVLCLLLFLLLLALFVPVRYLVSGKMEDEIFIQARVSWFLHIVSWSFAYEDGKQEQRLRILGIPLAKRKKTKPDEKAEEFEETEELEETEEADRDALCADITEEKAARAEMGVEDSGASETTADIADTGKSSFSGKIRGFVQKIRNVFSKLRTGSQRVKDKVSDIKNIITDETIKTAVGYILSELKYLLRHFRFRKIDADLTFSLGDPAVTGQVLGIFCMIPFLYQYSFHIYPDFEAEAAYVKGTFRIQGKVRLVHVLMSVIRLLRKKEFRAMIQKIMIK